MFNMNEYNTVRSMSINVPRHFSDVLYNKIAQSTTESLKRRLHPYKI
jgi:hypothetical protein